MSNNFHRLSLKTRQDIHLPKMGISPDLGQRSPHKNWLFNSSLTFKSLGYGYKHRKTVTVENNRNGKKFKNTYMVRAAKHLEGAIIVRCSFFAFQNVLIQCFHGDRNSTFPWTQTVKRYTLWCTVVYKRLLVFIDVFIVVHLCKKKFYKE